MFTILVFVFFVAGFVFGEWKAEVMWKRDYWEQMTVFLDKRDEAIFKKARLIKDHKI